MDNGAPPLPSPDEPEAAIPLGDAHAALTPGTGPMIARDGTTDREPVPPRTMRRRVVSWALWDWGSAAFNAVITTFVFTPWLTSRAFVDPVVVAAADAEGAAGGSATDALAGVIDQHSTWLGWGLTAAGLVIALLAPVAGARADESGRRRFWLGVHTGVVVVLSAAMFVVRPDPASLTRNLVVGIFLLAAGNIFFELAAVNYNATLAQVSTPATVGRVSGIGWGAGYLGGIVLLLVLFVGFINPEVGWFGVTGDDGMDIRVSMLVAALWFGGFAIPVLVAVPDNGATRRRRRVGLRGAYRRLFADIGHLWRNSRDTLRFLIASAVYRDGLAGVFTFGAVIAAGTFGFTTSEVIVFAIAANVVAGAATITSGWLDDRIGAKRVVVGSLVGLLVAGMGVFFGHAGGATVFWVFGLTLSAFVGPAQSASRTLLARVIPPGRESEIFGLYATTGRAASFMAPLAWSTFIAVGGSQHWGIVGIVLVLAVGLGLLLPVRTSPATLE